MGDTPKPPGRETPAPWKEEDGVLPQTTGSGGPLHPRKGEDGGHPHSPGRGAPVHHLREAEKWGAPQPPAGRTLHHRWEERGYSRQPTHCAGPCHLVNLE